MRRALPGEKMTTLDGVEERQLTTDMLMITDTLGSIAVGGVMGGAETEVNDRSRNILLEAASFDYINNRRTSQALRLPSEATARFNEGISPEMPVPAAVRCAGMMATLAAGEVVEGIEDCYPTEQRSAVIDLRLTDVKRLLGMDVPTSQIADILHRLEFIVNPSTTSKPSCASLRPGSDWTRPFRRIWSRKSRASLAMTASRRR